MVLSEIAFGNSDSDNHSRRYIPNDPMIRYAYNFTFPDKPFKPRTLLTANAGSKIVADRLERLDFIVEIQ